jgi:hypothetical protein
MASVIVDFTVFYGRSFLEYDMVPTNVPPQTRGLQLSSELANDVLDVVLEANKARARLFGTLRAQNHANGACPEPAFETFPRPSHGPKKTPISSRRAQKNGLAGNRTPDHSQVRISISVIYKVDARCSRC